MAVPLKHILYRTVGRHFGNKVTTYISILRLVQHDICTHQLWQIQVAFSGSFACFL